MHVYLKGGTYNEEEVDVGDWAVAPLIVIPPKSANLGPHPEGIVSESYRRNPREKGPDGKMMFYEIESVEYLRKPETD